MRLFPAINPAILAAVFCAAFVAVPAFAQYQQPAVIGQPVNPGYPRPQIPTSAIDQMNQAQSQAQRAASTARTTSPAPAAGGPASIFDQSKTNNMTKEERDAALKDKQSNAYKAAQLAKKARETGEFDKSLKIEKNKRKNPIDEVEVPPPLEFLQQIRQSHGFSKEGELIDDVVSKKMSLDLRLEAQREAALSYGARGGLAKRSYMIVEHIKAYETTFDKVYNFRSLLIRAPSGLLIEPPIVNESLDALAISEGGSEAAVSDQILRISKQAKIVTAPRDWRTYLDFQYESKIVPPPKVLWPKNEAEQARWNQWVKEGWEAGYMQGEQIFEANLQRLTVEFEGMVRYRTLLAEGKISQPYALQEDRGVTGGRNEMRVGDRALRITGPSQFLTGSDLWKPADR